MKSDPINIDKLKAKQGYRINRGLKLNYCHIASIPDQIKINELTDLLFESFSDYPSVYKPNSNLRQYANTIINQCKDINYDVWLVYNREQSKLVGIGVCRLENEVVVLQVVKVRPSYLKDEVNAALAFSICKYYLNDKRYKYVTDGERNIRHISNYQNFLISVLGFRRIYCKLHIVYHPLINPIIKILYPFRKVLEKIENCNRLCYNISCVLKQEEIARKS